MLGFILDLLTSWCWWASHQQKAGISQTNASRFLGDKFWQKDVHKLGLTNNPTTVSMKDRRQATKRHNSGSLTSNLGSSSSVVSKLLYLVKPQIPHLQIRMITLASWDNVGMRVDKINKTKQTKQNKTSAGETQQVSISPPPHSTPFFPQIISEQE